jgi:hypothetical protein
MNTAAYLIVTVLVVTALYFGVFYLVRAYLRYQGTMVVTCPETGRPAIVEVDAIHAALTSATGIPDLRIENCWRWPLKESCGQECLANLDIAPKECLVRGVLMQWYRGKTCAHCGKPFADVHWIDRKPALQSPEGLLPDWGKIQLEELPTVLDSYLPVCWDCYIAQSFLHEHPELVVYRPLSEWPRRP